MNAIIDFNSCSGAPPSAFVMRRFRIRVCRIVIVGSRFCKNATDDPGFANLMGSLLFCFLKLKPGSYGIRP
jgi:hypothetical protein